jgi:hypothetical protein
MLLVGCYSGTVQDANTAGDRGSQGDPHVVAPAMEGGSAPAAAQSFDDAGGPVELGVITLTAPAGWQRMPPSSSFVAAEFTLSPAEGDDMDGRLTVSTAGGSVEANIERWKGQFGPEVKEAPQEEIDAAGAKITIVDFSGEFNDQRGPFAPAVQRADYRMIAAIVPLDGQLYFIKATGPQKTIAFHADKVHQFIRTVGRKQ